ncbi:MAG TPA: BTAD domain-containing putative transcriptional regulator [Candidatus Limnocylindria bacterium]|nr:BTAD domain-containing putative transcriptional regulator [Candidatus Limnocylindria bacterium]
MSSSPDDRSSRSAGLADLRERARQWLRRLSPEAVAGVDLTPRVERTESFGIARAASLSTVVVVNALAAHAEAAEDAYRAALDAERGSRDPSTLFRLHCAAAELRAGRGDLPGARAALRSADEVAARVDASAVPTAYLLLARGAVLELEGSLDDAYVAYRGAEREAEAAGARYARTKATILAARLSPTPEQEVPALRDAVRTLAQEGYRDLLVARPAVFEWLREQGAAVDPSLRLSSTLGLLTANSAMPAHEAPARGPAPLEILLLGPFAMRHDGATVGQNVWRTAKAKEMLAILATAEGRPVPRDELMVALWPDSEPAAAVSKFHFTLHSLRRELASAGLGDHVKVTKVPAGYALELPKGSTLDTDAFEQGARRAREAKAAGDAKAHLQLLREAVSLHRGTLLADLTGAWIDELRERVEAAFLSVARELAWAELETGEPQATIDLCHRILEKDPYDEGGHRLLLRAYHRAGATDLAIRHYQSLERRLRRDLDTEPEPATRELFLALRDVRTANAPA